MRTQFKRKPDNAFTLIEIMVVVIIIGILAATIVAEFGGTTDDAKIGVAKSNLSVLENQLERFNLHMDRFPTTEEGLDALVTAPSDGGDKWRGPYVKQIRKDPWKNDFQYRNPGTHGVGQYDLWSMGADGQTGGEGVNADIGNWEEE